MLTSKNRLGGSVTLFSEPEVVNSIRTRDYNTSSEMLSERERFYQYLYIFISIPVPQQTERAAKRKAVGAAGGAGRAAGGDAQHRSPRVWAASPSAEEAGPQSTASSRPQTSPAAAKVIVGKTHVSLERVNCSRTLLHLNICESYLSQIVISDSNENGISYTSCQNIAKRIIY